MRPRLLLHIPRGVVKVAFYLLAAGVVLFFALTRTQAGRDTLARTVEQQFNERYAGTLSIGALSGNLFNTLYAEDVRLMAPNGEVVAIIDSVVVRQRWQSLFQRTIAISRLDVIRPEVWLRRQADSTWQLAHTLRRIDGPRAPSLWQLYSADVRLRDGHVQTLNLGARPSTVSDGQVFDYTNTSIGDVQLHATLDWHESARLIDIHTLSAQLADPALPLHDLQGQVVLEGDALTLNAVRLQLGGTDLRLNGSASPFNDLSAATFEVELTESPVSFTEVRRLIPALPFSGIVQAKAQVHGTWDALVIESFRLRRRGSVVQVSGTVLGLPQAPDFELAVEDSQVRREDLRALLPENPWVAQLGVDSMALGLYAKGRRSASRGWSAEAFVDMGSRAGAFAGSLAVALPPNASIRYQAAIRTEALDVGLLAGLPNLRSRLSGTILGEGTGTSAATMASTWAARLGPSSLSGRAFDSLQVDLQLQGGVADGRLRYREGDGVLVAEGQAGLTNAQQDFGIDLWVNALDLGPMLQREALSTALSGQFNVTGQGRIGPALTATLVGRLDSITVRTDDTVRRIGANDLTVQVNPLSPLVPRIELGGSLVRGTVSGAVAFVPLWRLGQLWQAGITDALSREWDKPRVQNDEILASALARDQAAQRRQAALATAASQALRRSGPDTTLTLGMDLTFTLGTLLEDIFPAQGAIQATTHLHGAFTVGPQSLSVEANLSADALATPSARLYGMRTTIQAAGLRDAPLERTMTAQLTVQADSLAAADRWAMAPQAVLTYQNQRAALALNVEPHSTFGPARLNAELAFQPSRNVLRFDEVSVTLAGLRWEEAEAQPITFFSDAIMVPGLSLTGQPISAAQPQRVSVRGIYSDVPQDSLLVEAQDFMLHALPGLSLRNLKLGGVLNTRLAFTGGGQRPTLTGDVHVGQLALNHFVLGDFQLTSSLLPGGTDVFVDAQLLPLADAAPPDSLPGIAQAPQPVQNALQLDGTLRLPETDALGQQTDPGALDLNVSVSRADLFFLEILFPTVLTNVSGSLTGGGTITGTPNFPLFDARVEGRNARFDIPAFNLSYAAQGDLWVDREGIHTDALQVTDATGGGATVQGSLRFNDYDFFSYDLSGRLDALQVMNVARSEDLAFYGFIWASGDATLTGPLYASVLRATNAVTSPESEIFIPITEELGTTDESFILYADSTGLVPDFQTFTRRRNVLSSRPTGERPFVDGLDMDLNLFAPPGSTVHLVIDPLLGDEIIAVGTGRIQIELAGGEFFTFGQFEVQGGDYLFTAGEVFVRRFQLQPGGTITWDGDPVDALLNIPAAFRTRASRAGLPNTTESNAQSLIPLVVSLLISGRVSAPQVELSLSVDQDQRSFLGNYQGLETLLNQPERAAEYATSVLLTNSFRLTTETFSQDLSSSSSQLAFNSLSQLVTSQLNRFLSATLPNVDLNFGLLGESTQDLDVTYGVALRLLDQRLIIRGQGVYLGAGSTTQGPEQSLQGEFVVEIRLNPHVSIEVFYRREGDVLSENALTSTTGAGLSYQTEFTSWGRFLRRFFGWLLPTPTPTAAPGDGSSE